MPASALHGKNEIFGWLRDIEDQLSTIIDVGAGAGVYRHAYQQLLAKGQLQNAHVKWIAVEAFEPYIEQFKLTDLYDDVLRADVLEIVDDLPPFDLILFGDVLEHFEKADVTRLLSRVRRLYDPYIVISIPTNYSPQDVVDGNVHEVHKHYWHFMEVIHACRDVDIHLMGRNIANIGVYKNWIIVKGEKGQTLLRNPPYLQYADRVCEHCKSEYYELNADGPAIERDHPELGRVLGVF